MLPSARAQPHHNKSALKRDRTKKWRQKKLITFGSMVRWFAGKTRKFTWCPTRCTTAPPCLKGSVATTLTKDQWCSATVNTCSVCMTQPKFIVSRSPKALMSWWKPAARWFARTNWPAPIFVRWSSWVMSAWASTRPLTITPMWLLLRSRGAPTWARKHWIRGSTQWFLPGTAWRQTLSRLRLKRAVTTCPHCWSAAKRAVTVTRKVSRWMWMATSPKVRAKTCLK